MLGDNIKKYRMRRGLTQEELGEKLNFSVHTIRKYESNERNPDVSTIINIADVLGVSVNKLSNNNISFSERLAVKLSKITFDNPEDNFKVRLAQSLLDNPKRSFSINEEIFLLEILRKYSPLSFKEFCHDNMEYINNRPRLYNFCFNSFHSEFSDENEYTKESFKWTQEELELLNNFKEFLIMKRNKDK